MTQTPSTFDALCALARRVRPLALAVVAAVCPLGAIAQDKPQASTDEVPAAEAAPAKSAFDGWDLSASPYTYHFHPSDEHEYVYAIGLIKHLEKNWIAGGSYFSNSFGQPSGYVYVGQRFDELPGFERWYLQWNVGILYGYVGKYQHKVPFNYKGFSPGFVPSVGYKFTDRIYGEIDILGNSGLMFTLVFPLAPAR